MIVRIPSALASIELVPWYEAELDLVGRATISEAELRAMIASEPGLAASLRRLIIELDAGAHELEWSADEELARRVTQLIERGLVRVHVEAHPLIYTTPVDETALPEHVVEPIVPVDETLHWVEVQLIGEDDEAISGARCKIVLPNGRAIIRTTDRFGLVRIDGVEDAGSCEISFPDLDSEAWENA